MHLEVPITGDFIKLGQFLKLANLVESGGHAKELIEAGEVSVDGDIVTSRGFLLHDGSLVSLGDTQARVVTDAGEDEYFDETTADDDFDPEKWRNM